MKTYGEWLAEERAKKGWTQNQLASKAGVSQPGIWNLEKGHSLNPQRSTREKIEKALGSSPSQEVLNEATIEGWGDLEEFEPHNESTWPSCTGIYVLYDADDRPAYVGRSTKLGIRARLKEHKGQKWYVEPLVSSGAFLSIVDEDICKKLEKLLIKLAVPLVNKQHRD